MPSVLSTPAPAKKRVVYSFSPGKPKTAYCYKLTPGKTETVKKPDGKISKMAKGMGAAAGKATQSTIKTTNKVAKKTLFIWPIKLVLLLLDIFSAPYGKMRGRDINFPLLWKAGALLLIADVFIYIIIDRAGGQFIAERANTAPHFMFLLVQIGLPGALAIGACSMIIGGIRLQQNKSFLQKFGQTLEPLPAFESGVKFKIGDIILSLRDMHTNLGAFGGIGTGKTVSFMIPLMRQFFQQLNHDNNDPKDEAQKVAALILDEKGDFIDSTIMEMILAGRPISDLVLIDPDLDLFRYNPLDPSQTPDENASKLAKVQKILGSSGGGGDNAYWDQTSQSTIKFFLQLLEVYKPKDKIGLDDIARFMRDDKLAAILCDEVEKKIEEKKAAYEINDELYGAIYDAVSSVRTQWIQLSANTKSILKTTINNMLGPIANNPRLQKVFCRDTNFQFKDLPNKGKIVLFRGSGIDKSTAKLICVCLKIDFQTWQKRRNGSAATAYGLNTIRTVLFICDEYQEFVTCGGEGDETFYGVSRSARTCAIVATQSLNSLKTAIKNPEQTNTLIQNITTWVFLRTTDKDTMELGALWAGQSKKEDFSTSQTTSGLLETASNLSGGSGKDSSVSISRKLEENFRKDDFSKLITITMEKSRTGPWYSEAIVYNYHDTDAEAESRCYKTRLIHYYYTDELRKQAAKNVSALDNVLYDRNWQRKSLQRGLIEIQRSREKAAEDKKKFLEEVEMRASLLEKSPTQQRQAKMLEEAKARHEATSAEISGTAKGGKVPGEIGDKIHKKLSPEEIEGIRTRRQALMTEQENAANEEDRTNIEREIARLGHMLALNQLLTLTQGTKVAATQGKEVLEANKNLLDQSSVPNEAIEEENAEAGGTISSGTEEMWDPANHENSEEDDEKTVDADGKINGLNSNVLSPYPSEEEKPEPIPAKLLQGQAEEENLENGETEDEGGGDTEGDDNTGKPGEENHPQIPSSPELSTEIQTPSEFEDTPPPTNEAQEAVEEGEDAANNNDGPPSEDPTAEDDQWESTDSLLNPKGLI